MALSWPARVVARRLRRGCTSWEPSLGDAATTRPGRGIATARGAEERLPWTQGGPAAPVTAPRSSRRDAIKDAKPFSHFLTDTFDRQHDYLRISLTEKCNLRCVYCMPEEGVPQSPPRELLTTPEVVLLSSVFVAQGVTKIRLTGGEPTVRRDILPLMQQIGALRPHGLRELCLTTNGLALHRKLEPMVEAGLTGVNLSLDTLDPWQFQIMTRRKGFEAVQKSIERIFELNRAGAGIKFKINCVVMRGVNDREIIPFVEMTRDRDVEVRFIEYMPFDGNRWSEGKMLPYREMLDVIRGRFPALQKARDHQNDTSKTWHVPGFAGRIGFITSMTHNFCGTCNRLRITSDGNLKVCLFGNAEVSLRDILRQANGGEPIDDEAYDRMKRAALDRAPGLASSDKPPVLSPNSEELLNVIGMAVKRKKEKHAGIGELEHMKNRPMILIDSRPSSAHRYRASDVQQINVGLDTASAPRKVPYHLLPPPVPGRLPRARLFSSTSTRRRAPGDGDGGDDGAAAPPAARLTHVSAAGTAHMVSVADKPATARTAKAACSVVFSSPAALRLVRANALAKGDVLGVARVAGIMAAKRTPDLIPLCHPVALSHVAVELEPAGAAPGGEGAGAPAAGDEGAGEGGGPAREGGAWRVDVVATVSCEGKTGVEMEALTAAAAAALTVYDMCKAVDKGMRVEGLRVVLKEGGKSGRWVEGMKTA